ncbi:MAG: 30S ribosomal protein S5 [Patescibacteria group bacterium]|nr:30S ribosomal protein S5 [Patescibacteria group bacterium]
MRHARADWNFKYTMADDTTQNTDIAQAEEPRSSRGPRARRGGKGREGAERRGGRGRREERPRSEFDQQTILVRRVARVMAGGRRFSFSAAIVIGDRKGRVGVGIGKGLDTALAIEKATRDAKRNMITVRTTKTMSIPHDVEAKSSSGIVEIRPAPNRGIIAGSAVKLVLELAGIKDVTAKILSGSKNKLNIARATVKALSQLKK